MTELRCNLCGPRPPPSPSQPRCTTRAEETHPLGEVPRPSRPCRHLPFVLSTVQRRDQFEAVHAQQLPKRGGAHEWAVEPQEAGQAEGRGKLRPGQSLSSLESVPSRCLATGSPAPRGANRPHRRVQLQWKRGSWALLNTWNLVCWGPI